LIRNAQTFLQAAFEHPPVKQLKSRRISSPMSHTRQQLARSKRKAWRQTGGLGGKAPGLYSSVHHSSMK